MKKAKIGLAYISDREDRYLPQCKASVEQHLDYPFVATTVIDDRHHRLGLAGAARAAWQWAVEQDVDYLFHMEEDMLLVRDVDIQEMVDVLVNNVELAQVILHRQPWSGDEHRVGGVMQRMGAEPKDCKSCDLRWSTQKFIFSLNPCLIPRDVLEIGWPDDNEAGITQTLLGMGYEFGFLGHPTDEPYVNHIGSTRGDGWKL